MNEFDHAAVVRATMGRAGGIALIDLTMALEHGLGVTDGAGPATFALFAFAARARRLLRAAYRLLDAGEFDSVVPLFRVMSEYLIVGRWLLGASKRDLEVWAISDLRQRLNVLRKVQDDSGLDEQTRQTLLEEITRTEQAIRGYAGDDEPLTKRAARRAGLDVPSLEVMATDTGLQFAYSYGYRLMSQTDVHATPLSIDAAYDMDEKGHKLRPVPRFALEGYDSYLVGAHLLLDIIRPLAERVPELGWEAPANMIAQSLVPLSQAQT